MSKQVGISVRFGPLAEPVEEQLNKQGYTLGEKRGFIEKLQHSLTMCGFHLLTERQYEAGLKKLHQLVTKHTVPLESEGAGKYE